MSNCTTHIITWSPHQDSNYRDTYGRSRDGIHERVNQIQAALRKECEWEAGHYHWTVLSDWAPLVIFECNHPEVHDLCKAIRTLPWKEPCEVQIMWKDEEMMGFALLFPMDDDWESQYNRGYATMMARDCESPKAEG